MNATFQRVARRYFAPAQLLAAWAVVAYQAWRIRSARQELRFFQADLERLPKQIALHESAIKARENSLSVARVSVAMLRQEL